MKMAVVRAVSLLFILCLGACSSVHTASPVALDRSARWVLLPSVNDTETPAAGARMDAVLNSLIRIHGISDLTVAPMVDGSSADLPVVPDFKAQQAALEWARKEGARYAFAGTVDEWRYKVGLDGEPAVSLTLSVIDVGTGKILWSGTAAKTGWSRQAVSAVAQDLIDQLLGAALASSH